MIVKNKRIILGVTGSIAVYKAIDLASKLTQAGSQVDVVMTEAATQFVTPLSFQSVTGRPVYTNLWNIDYPGGLPTHIAHIGLGEGADLLVIAPATANTIAKIAQGLADDLLSIVALAARCPLVVAPAMDGGMFEHPATQANLHTLQQRGAVIVEPEIGRFASGLIGKGRLPETPALIGAIRRTLGLKGLLANRRVMITAGGTQEAIDPVRFITNRSSGKQGYAIAQAAIDAGAKVTLISATDTLPIPYGVDFISVQSASDMLAAVQAQLGGTDVLIMAAAVADFRPVDSAEHKIKKSDNPNEELILSLARTADILATISHHPQRPRVVVGFAAETQDLLNNAQSKLQHKKLDFIVANDISADDAGFQVETNRVVIIDKTGHQERLALMTKAEVAEHIIQRVCSVLQSSATHPA